MSTYNDVLRQAALAVNALVGTTPADLESAYSTNPLTSINFGSAVIPQTKLIDAVLSAEAGLVMAVLSTGDHPWRESFRDATAPLAYGDPIPAVGAGGGTVVGIYGAVRDSTSGEPCTRNELEQIRDRVINPNGMWKIDVFWFAINDRRLYHTRTAATIDVCTYNRPNALTLDLTGNILLPDVLVSAYVDGALAECVRDDEFVEQAGLFGGMYTAWINGIKSGLTSVDPTTKIDEKAG
jgi:hypothetical protein